MLIAMAGLPGTGKSTLAKSIAARLHALVYDKDEIRAALFPISEIEYSSRQNDFCVDLIYQVFHFLVERNPERHLILDGSTFSRAGQIDRFYEAANRMKQPWRVLECIADESAVRQRMAAAGTGHRAANRSFELYREIKDAAVVVPPPKVVIDTGRHSINNCTDIAVSYVTTGEAG